MSYSSMPGYGFHPTEEELVNHYLRLKMLGGHDHLISSIAELDVLKFEPWQLPEKSEVQTNDSAEWYFISPRTTKYRKSNRADRTTNAGYWKATGKDRSVRVEGTGEEIAIKKTLVYHQGRVPNGIKTSWIMHEFNPTFKVPNQKKDYVVIKLKKNDDDDVDVPNSGGGETSTAPVVASHYQFSSPMDSNLYNTTMPDYDPELQAQIASLAHCFAPDGSSPSYQGSSYNEYGIWGHQY